MKDSLVKLMGLVFLLLSSELARGQTASPLDDNREQATRDDALSESSLSPPYGPSESIDSVKFDFATHKRMAQGSDNWPMTWAVDGNQYTAWGDGGGFRGSNQNGRVKLGVARIKGDGDDYSATNVWGGINGESPAEFDGKSYGILCVDGTLYMWVASQPARHMESCQLAWSTNLGKHWQLVDWSFKRSDQLSIPTFLNFGRDYQDARDDFVYSYYIHPTWGPEPPAKGNYGFDVNRPGMIYLTRVPKGKILSRRHYQFYAGSDDLDQPTWSESVRDKQPVFRDPNGVGWNVSASYATPMKRFLLCTEHHETHVGNFGIFDAPAPWGPWTTVLYEQQWGESEIEASAFFWSFPNRWFQPDGQFTMVFSGKNTNDSWNTIEGRFRF